MEEHVHLLISIGNIEKYSDIIKNIKSASSKWIRENFTEQCGFLWQDGYASFTVSYSSVESVKNYIVNQEKHHLSNTFENEYTMFLNRHNVSYDNSYHLG
jgi:putative transposase